MRPPFPARVLSMIVAAASHGFAISSAHAAEAQHDIVPLVWDCSQSHDAAFHVVCRPTCATTRVSAPASADPDRHQVQPAWGQPAHFRSARQPDPTMDMLDGEAVAANCGQNTQSLDRIHASTGRPAATHLVPLAERGSSEIFTGKPWKVPLYSRPTDPDSVTRLLREVLCGNAACSVQYGHSQPTSIARY